MVPSAIGEADPPSLVTSSSLRLWEHCLASGLVDCQAIGWRLSMLGVDVLKPQPLAIYWL